MRGWGNSRATNILTSYDTFSGVVVVINNLVLIPQVGNLYQLLFPDVTSALFLSMPVFYIVSSLCSLHYLWKHPVKYFKHREKVMLAQRVIRILHCYVVYSVLADKLNTESTLEHFGYQFQFIMVDNASSFSNVMKVLNLVMRRPVWHAMHLFLHALPWKQQVPLQVLITWVGVTKLTRITAQLLLLPKLKPTTTTTCWLFQHLIRAVLAGGPSSQGDQHDVLNLCVFSQVFLGFALPVVFSYLLDTWLVGVPEGAAEVQSISVQDIHAIDVLLFLGIALLCSLLASILYVNYVLQPVGRGVLGMLLS